MKTQISPADWRTIRRVFRGSSSCGIASVNEDGSPHVTPIGSLDLGEEARGTYFEEYTDTLTKNLGRDSRICAMAVTSGPLIWAMLRGKATQPLGVRLYGTAGERREATPAELERFLHRVRIYRFFRGYRLVWGKLRMVREVSFEAYEPVRVPPLGPGSWSA